jgi:CHAT domain-containing protein
VAETAFGSTGWFVFRELPNKFMRARAAYLTGRTEEARKIYDELLANVRTRDNGEILWQLLFDRARMAEAEGKDDVALRFYLESVDVVEQQRRSIASETSKIGFAGNKQTLYESVVDLLVRQGQPARAFEYVERAKSRALVDLLAERQNFASAGQAGTTETLKQLATLEQQYAVLSTKGESRTRLRSAMTNLAGDLTKKSPELASLVTVSAPRAEDIQAELAPDQTLLEYYGQGDELYAFTVTRQSIQAVKLDGKGLEKDVRAFREALAKVGTEAYRPLAEALYDRLITPAPGALGKPHLIIVGHGALHYLPFNALSDGRQFLVDKASVQFLPSASVLQFLVGRKPATARDLLLLGNPDLGDAAMDLPGAEAEVKAIKGYWPNSIVLMRKAATKGALAKTGQLFKVIHVAAHGEYQADQPLASRLLLAPEAGDNGLLTAGDLYAMRLNADLVTLSACETGMGKVLSGDDVVGLSRGFLFAGANSIVASLWPVSDDETRYLMTNFYRNLKTMAKGDALRQAQLETKKKYPHPFFWSAFQLTGMGK